MHELFLVPLAVDASRELAFSARPDAPVIAARPRRERRRLRGYAARLLAPRPSRLDTEEPCAT